MLSIIYKTYNLRLKQLHTQRNTHRHTHTHQYTHKETHTETHTFCQNIPSNINIKSYSRKTEELIENKPNNKQVRKAK